MLCQHIQNLWRVARMRTIVEGEGDLGARSVAVKENCGMTALQNRTEHLPDSTWLSLEIKSDCRLEGDSHSGADATTYCTVICV